jgi:hypothetical protein
MVDKTQLNRVGWRHFPAQARPHPVLFATARRRMERVFGTLQRRLQLLLPPRPWHASAHEAQHDLGDAG